MMISTRFAPSPTGDLHIGGLRTALFNWLISRHSGGKFFLRLEDTDQKRSHQKHVDSIINSIKWLGLTWDGEIIYQSSRKNRHVAIAKELINKGLAYYCYMTEEEIKLHKEKFPYQKVVSPWRDGDKSSVQGVAPSIRLKIQDCASDEFVEIADLVQGNIRMQKNELDDMVIVRSDGSPTYMLSSVVDDHDMGITHIVRGDDHINNAFRQNQIYDAMNWNPPSYAHIPLIHASDGQKLSKRSNAISAEHYINSGYLPEAMLNYLLRLGWGYGNKEIFSKEEAIALFNLDNISKSAARFDQDKLNFLNKFYIKLKSDSEIMELVAKEMGSRLTASHAHITDKTIHNVLSRAIQTIKTRGNTISDMADFAMSYLVKVPKDNISEQVQAILAHKDADAVITALYEGFQTIKDNGRWCKEQLVLVIQNVSTKYHLKSGEVMKILRCALFGTLNSPPIYEGLDILGAEQVLNRIK